MSDTPTCKHGEMVWRETGWRDIFFRGWVCWQGMCPAVKVEAGVASQTAGERDAEAAQTGRSD